MPRYLLGILNLFDKQIGIKKVFNSVYQNAKFMKIAVLIILKITKSHKTNKKYFSPFWPIVAKDCSHVIRYFKLYFSICDIPVLNQPVPVDVYKFYKQQLPETTNTSNLSMHLLCFTD